MNEQDRTEEYEQCTRCGRKLKNPEARRVGMGKVCQKKAAKATAEQPKEDKQ